jgi:hypothetical protein
MSIEYTAVTQPISLQMSSSAPAVSVSVDGCHASPSTFMGDGTPHLESVDPSCNFSLSFSNSGSTRTGFQVAGDFSAISPVHTSCSVGTCPALSLTAFEQDENTFRATPTTPSMWDAELVIPVTGTQFGSQDVTGCAIRTSGEGGRATCQAWFDYGTVATISNPVAVSSSERWFTAAQNAFRQTTGGNNYTVGYIDQFNVSFAVSPAASGTVSPSNSSLWEGYGSISVNETPAHGFGFVSWAADSPGITLAAKDNSSTAAIVHGAGTITATFVALVNQPIALSMAEQGGQAATFSLSGCSVSPTSLVGNGTSTSIGAIPSCNILVTSPDDTQALRYRFSARGPSSTLSVPTCSGGSCPAVASTYYEQLSESFAYAVVDGGSAPRPSLNFTSLGANANQTEATTPTISWLDFGTQWSLSAILPGASQNERWAASSGISGTASVSGHKTTAYQHEYSIVMLASPTSCGTTTPTGISWEPAEAVFSIEASGSKSCTFSTWSATSGILIAVPTNLNSTVSTQGPGTITASFTQALVPSTTPTIPILYVAIFVGLAVVIGCVALVARWKTAGKSE